MCGVVVAPIAAVLWAVTMPLRLCYQCACRSNAAPSRGPKVLVVGAGAVGQVYARHLIRGGSEVLFWAKEKYRDGLLTAANGKGVPMVNAPRRAVSTR